VVQVCNPSYSEGRGRRTAVRPNEAKGETLTEKQTKRARGMVQVVAGAHLSSKHKALSSNPNTPKKKKKGLM
jgi:hypothetical protein